MSSDDNGEIIQIDFTAKSQEARVEEFIRATVTGEMDLEPELSLWQRFLLWASTVLVIISCKIDPLWRSLDDDTD